MVPGLALTAAAIPAAGILTRLQHADHERTDSVASSRSFAKGDAPVPLLYRRATAATAGRCSGESLGERAEGLALAACVPHGFCAIAGPPVRSCVAAGEHAGPAIEPAVAFHGGIVGARPVVVDSRDSNSPMPASRSAEGDACVNLADAAGQVRHEGWVVIFEFVVGSRFRGERDACREQH